MPFETAVSPFTGDANAGAFFENVWLPFARDDVKWSDNLRGSPNGAGTSDVQIQVARRQRSGSPETIDSPEVYLAPFVGYSTIDDNVFITTSDGIDVAEDIRDQPGNPGNDYPSGGWNSRPAGNQNVRANHRCPTINDLLGTYDAYWLFSDAAGSYVHCVVKISNREYRHWHVGLFTPLHPDLDDDAFYVTGHFCSELNDNYAIDDTPSGKNHGPYQHAEHGYPFQGHRTFSETFSLRKQEASQSVFYMPGINTGIDWYRMNGNLSTLNSGEAPAKQTTRQSPVDKPSQIGNAGCTGYLDGLGAALFSCDRTFTSNTNSLIPIFVGVNLTFASVTKFGVVAQVPDVFRINMRDYAPEQEITVGSDTFVVFPVINDDAANVLAAEGYSGYEGLAYKKITDTVPG